MGFLAKERILRKMNTKKPVVFELLVPELRIKGTVALLCFILLIFHTQTSVHRLSS